MEETEIKGARDRNTAATDTETGRQKKKPKKRQI